MLMTTMLSTLVLAAAAPAGFDLSCSYAGRAHGGELERTEHCARRDRAAMVFAPEALRDMQFDKDGLSAVAVGDGWRWVRANGVSIAVITFDNGPDEFVHGLTRGRSPDGAMSYYDMRLRPVLSTPYAWVEPFINGLAAVCEHCRIETASDGEHHILVGGRWGAIDRSGKLALGMRDDAESLRRDLQEARTQRRRHKSRPPG